MWWPSSFSSSSSSSSQQHQQQSQQSQRPQSQQQQSQQLMNWHQVQYELFQQQQNALLLQQQQRYQQQQHNQFQQQNQQRYHHHHHHHHQQQQLSTTTSLPFIGTTTAFGSGRPSPPDKDGDGHERRRKVPSSSSSSRAVPSPAGATAIAASTEQQQPSSQQIQPLQQPQQQQPQQQQQPLPSSGDAMTTMMQMISEEMNELSVEERTQILEEVHGVLKVDMPIETSEFVFEKIKDLKLLALKQKIPRPKRKWYEKALFYFPALEDDTQFYLMFLRADRYDVDKAAYAISKYFEYKVELFGLPKICKRISLIDDTTGDDNEDNDGNDGNGDDGRHANHGDLSSQDIECFKTGGFIYLPFKDSSNRLLLWVNMNVQKFSHWTNYVRYMWYETITTIQNDEIAQLNGLVDVLYAHPPTTKSASKSKSTTKTTTASSSSSPPSKSITSTTTTTTATTPTEETTTKRTTTEMVSYLNQGSYTSFLLQGVPMINILPFRMVGFHMCYEDSRVSPLIGIIQFGVGKDLRLRTRSHFGSSLESKYALMQFGIPVDKIPFEEDEIEEEHEEDKPSKLQSTSTTNTVAASSLSPADDDDDDDDDDDPPPKTLKKYALWHLSRRKRQERKQKRREQKELQDLLSSSSQSSDDGHGHQEHQRIILYPSEYDVLLGRGRPFQEWAGNQYLVRCVDEVRDEYMKLSDKFEKTLMTMDVLAKIHEKGGRFIQRVNTTSSSSSSVDGFDASNDGDGISSSTASAVDEKTLSHKKKRSSFSPSSMITSETTTFYTTKGWRVVPNDVAREKISHTFRTKKSASSSDAVRQTQASTPSPSSSSLFAISSPFFSLNNGDQQQQQQQQSLYPPHTSSNGGGDDGIGFVKSNGLYKMSDDNNNKEREGITNQQPMKRSKQGNET